MPGPLAVLVRDSKEESVGGTVFLDVTPKVFGGACGVVARAIGAVGN